MFSCYGECSLIVLDGGERSSMVVHAGKGALHGFHVTTVAFQGIEAVPVDVQVQIAPGGRISPSSACPTRRSPRAASASGRRSMPPACRCRRSGSSSISPRPTCPRKAATTTCRSRSALMAAMGAVPGDQLGDFVVARRTCRSTAPSRRSPACCRRRSRPTPAAAASSVPAASGPEAAWASRDMAILAPRSLIAIANHFRGTQVLSRPEAGIAEPAGDLPDLADIKGQETRQARARGRRRRRPQSADGRPARRRQVDAGEPAAVDPAAALAGRTARSVDDRLDRRRDRQRQARPAGARSARRIIPPRWRRWSAAACARGRARCRSPITACSSSTNCRNSRRRCSIRSASRSETGETVIARANYRISYPVARSSWSRAMNPCRCGMAGEPGACLPARPALRRRLPGAHFRAAARPHRHPHRSAGGLGDRPDPAGRRPSASAAVAPRVAAARAVQRERFARLGVPSSPTPSARRRRSRGGAARRAAMTLLAPPPRRCGSPPAAITAC